MIYLCRTVLFGLCLISAVAWATGPLPPLKQFEDQVKFFVTVKKSIPDLFSQSVLYDINLFELLSQQIELEKKLYEESTEKRQASDYRKAMEEKNMWILI
jgi:hypothetical protein